MKFPNPKVEALVANPKLHAIVTSNSSSFPYSGAVSATMFFPEGEMQVNDLNTFGPDDNRPYCWSPSTVLTWPDGSVKRAQVKTYFYLNANELSYTIFAQGKTPVGPFQWDPELANKVGSNLIQSQTIMTCDVNGVSVAAQPFSGSVKVLKSDNASLNLRFRTHFRSGLPAVQNPLSLTTYVELEYLSPIIKTTFVIGNDTLETPVNGGMNITNLNVSAPIAYAIFQRPSYGSMNFSLADGQTMAVKYIFSARNDSWALNNMNALSQSLIQGFDYYPTIQESKAMSLAPLPPTRIQTNQIVTAHNQVNNSVSFPNAEPKTPIGHIDWNPPSTGAQADFASTMPLDLQKACMAYSNKMLSRVYLSCLRESFRPSFYWETRNGVEDRCSLLNYPNGGTPPNTGLFFWSGRPHFHPSWNQAYPIWLTRTGSFSPGDFGGWGGSDNQHLSNNHLRYLYQITLDPYLEDILKYYLTVDYWNFYTQWLPNIEAERGSRSVKDGLELCELFPSEPESIAFKPRIDVKIGHFNNAIAQNITKFGIAGVAPFDACDVRVMNGVNCPIQQAANLGNIVSVGWQTGFHMELQAMSTNNTAYLDFATTYFLPNGTPKTYFLFTDPNNYNVGGIGITWWSGWIILALKNPNHPNSPFILNTVKPVIESAMPVQGFWSNEDGWKAW